MMPRPEAPLIKDLSLMVRQYPSIVVWLEQWCDRELRELPRTSDHTATAQGRCQVLMELHELLLKAPDYATTPAGTSQSNAYR